MQDTPIEFHAAMFRALGRQTKLSRSGFSVVFARPQLGRSDLSEDAERAAAQLHAAGIDLAAVTPADVEAYRQWRSGLDHAKRIGQARILVTRPFGAQRGRELVPSNAVALVDGFGERVESITIRRLEVYDPDARNAIGGRGAYKTVPDYARIERAIEEIRARHPEFAGAPVQDNNQRGETI